MKITDACIDCVAWNEASNFFLLVVLVNIQDSTSGKSYQKLNQINMTYQ